MKHHIEAAVVRQHARSHWFGILGRLAPTLEQALARSGRHVPCPIHGGQDGFRVFNDVNERGGGICNTCGSFSDGFALLMWANHWGFREALEAVAHDLQLDAGSRWMTTPPRQPRPSPAPVRGQDDGAAEAALRRVWSETLDPQDTKARPLQRYLLRRGIDATPDPGVVRFHPGLGYYQDRSRIGTYPAIIARVSNAQGQPVSLHRIYLTPEGRKAPVASPKKMMVPLGPVVGGAIRLYPAGPTLGITEGIETALVIRQRTGMPVWAGVSAKLLERFQPPPEVSLLVIWADLDLSGTGEDAAVKLHDRLIDQRLRVAIHVPRGPIPVGAKGLDWADLWSLKDLEAA